MLIATKCTTKLFVCTAEDFFGFTVGRKGDKGRLSAGPVWVGKDGAVGGICG